MADFGQVDIYKHVVMVDRCVNRDELNPRDPLLSRRPNVELIFDGVRITWEEGEVEKIVPQFVAEWFFTRTTQFRVWTKDSEYVTRLAIKNPSRRLLDAIGPEAADDSPIEIDPTVIEGSDVTLHRTDPTVVRNVNVPPQELRERQGRGAHLVATAR